MIARTALAALIAGAALVLPAMAQDTERYRLERTEDGFVRMDMETGQMSICRERGEQLICRAAAEERDGSRAEIGELKARIEALEKRLAEIDRRSLLRPDTVLPSQEEFERSLSYMEQFFRRFFGLVREFEDEEAPDRT